MAASKSELALHEAVAAIYFADSSDYLSALWSVVRALDPEVAELLQDDEENAYNTTYEQAYGYHPDHPPTEGETMIHFTEEHLGPDATHAQAERLAEILGKLGWEVKVGPGPAWAFGSDERRARFEADWDASLPLLFKNRRDLVARPVSFRELAITTLNLADECEASGDKIAVVLRRLHDVRETALDEALDAVERMTNEISDVKWGTIDDIKNAIRAAKKRKV